MLIKRKWNYLNALGNFKVYIDSEFAIELKNGEELELDVPDEFNIQVDIRKTNKQLNNSKVRKTMIKKNSNQKIICSINPVAMISYTINFVILFLGLFGNELWEMYYNTIWVILIVLATFNILFYLFFLRDNYVVVKIEEL